MRWIIHFYSWPVVWSLLQPSLQLAAEKKKSNVYWDGQKLEKRAKSYSLDSISCKNKRITHILIDHFKKENWKRCVVETIHVCLWRCVPVPVLELETQQIFKPSYQQLPWKKKTTKSNSKLLSSEPPRSDKLLSLLNASHFLVNKLREFAVASKQHSSTDNII